MGETFKNIRDGDRFWYESCYPSEIIDEIKQTTFADVINRNVDGSFCTENIFRTHSGSYDNSVN